MWLSVSRPASIDADADVTVIAWHKAVGEPLAIGDAVVDLRVETGARVARDCPAVSTCRIIAQEAAWLRECRRAPGDAVAPGKVLALLSTEANEPPAPPRREARSAAAAVLMHADWWLEG